MNITKYEIDFINVKDADAILIHFLDDNKGVEKLGLNNRAFEVRRVEAIPTMVLGKFDCPQLLGML